MMDSPSGERNLDEQLLVGYLLGQLSGEEAERLDELSIADDEVAWRLRAAENDLVDAYVRGELSGETLDRFRTVYMVSPQRRQKVEFAGALHAFEQRSGRVAAAGPTRESRFRRRGMRPASGGRRSAAWLLPQWTLAAAAVVAIVGAAYFFVENRRLRQEVIEMQAARTEVERTAQGLRTELEQERSTAAAIRDELARLRQSLPSVRMPSLRPFLLLPMRRGAGEIATVALPNNAGQVPFRLRLESDDFQSYEAALRDPASGQVVWRSGQLSARSDGSGRYVDLQVPASLLKPQNYTLELSGRPANGPAEFLTSYAFRVLVE